MTFVQNYWKSKSSKLFSVQWIWYILYLYGFNTLIICCFFLSLESAAFQLYLIFPNSKERKNKKMFGLEIIWSAPIIPLFHLSFLWNPKALNTRNLTLKWGSLKNRYNEKIKTDKIKWYEKGKKLSHFMQSQVMVLLICCLIDITEIKLILVFCITFELWMYLCFWDCSYMIPLRLPAHLFMQKMINFCFSSQNYLLGSI